MPGLGYRSLGNGILTTSISNSIISDTSGPYGTPIILENNTFGGFSSPSINDQGTIAFAASRSSEGAGIFEISNGQLTNIANTSGAFNSFDIFSPYPADQGGIVSLNQLGTIAFEATLKSGSTGIFTSPDPVADKVIATGDSLLGATVTSLSFASTGLNNEQQVAFFAKLSNGTSGIFRADIQTTQPRPIPESNDVLEILVFGIIIMGAWERKNATKLAKKKRQKALFLCDG